MHLAMPPGTSPGRWNSSSRLLHTLVHLHLPHLHPRSSNSLSQALPTRAAEVVGAVLVVAAMPPHPTTSSTTLPSARVRLKATLTMAMSSSLRRDCLYAMKYWSFLGWNGVEWRETW